MIFFVQSKIIASIETASVSLRLYVIAFTSSINIIAGWWKMAWSNTAVVNLQTVSNSDAHFSLSPCSKPSLDTNTFWAAFQDEKEKTKGFVFVPADHHLISISTPCLTLMRGPRSDGKRLFDFVKRRSLFPSIIIFTFFFSIFSNIACVS